jgi:hypothetical protein
MLGTAAVVAGIYERCTLQPRWNVLRASQEHGEEEEDQKRSSCHCEGVLRTTDRAVLFMSGPRTAQKLKKQQQWYPIVVLLLSLCLDRSLPEIEKKQRI